MEKITGSEITLFLNNTITNDPCCICGARTDPDGLDYGIKESLVCFECAEKLRPDLVEIRKQVNDFIAKEIYYTKQDIRKKIKDVFNESIEERILRVIPDPDSIPF